MLAGRRISGLVTPCIQTLPTGVAVGGDRTGLTATHGLALSARRALNASFRDAMTVTLVLGYRPIATEAFHGGVQVCVRERRGHSLDRVGDEELPRLRTGPRFAPVRGRGRADGLGPAAARLPDGALGLTYLVQGWVVGSEGFSQTESIVIVLAWVLSVAWMIWLVVVAWRMQDAEPRRLADEGGGRPDAIQTSSH